MHDEHACQQNVDSDSVCTSGQDSGYLRVEGDKITILDPAAKEVDLVGKSTRTYRVTQVLPTYSSQQDVYKYIGQPVLDWFWQGFNATGDIGSLERLSIAHRGRDCAVAEHNKAKTCVRGPWCVWAEDGIKLCLTRSWSAFSRGLGSEWQWKDIYSVGRRRWKRFFRGHGHACGRGAVQQDSLRSSSVRLQSCTGMLGGVSPSTAKNSSHV
jgi:hypothetical protein